MTSLRVVRWILVALTATLAVVLLVNGHVVLGVLLGAMAVTRVVFFVKMRHRREMSARASPSDASVAASDPLRRAHSSGRVEPPTSVPMRNRPFWLRVVQYPGFGRKRSNRSPWSSTHSALPPES
jgi:hypothetical protein